MSEPRKISINLVAQWVQKAENDLRNAEHTFKMPLEECPLDTVCFHAQQSVEKYVKALLTYLATDFPKTHDIGELFELLPVKYRPDLGIHEQEKLSLYATDSRYPGLEESLEESLPQSEAAEALLIARKVREIIRTHLPKESL